MSLPSLTDGGHHTDLTLTQNISSNFNKFLFNIELLTCDMNQIEQTYREWI